MELYYELFVSQQVPVNFGQFVLLGIIVLVIFAETSTLKGLAISGISYFLPLLGILAGVGLIKLSIGFMFICCFIASFIGDLVAYKRGYNQRENAFPKRDNYYFRRIYLEGARLFRMKYGQSSIVIGKFWPYLRNLIPMLAGADKMKFLNYFLLNLLACLIYFSLLLVPFYYLGKGFVFIWPVFIMLALIGILFTFLFWFYRVYVRLRLNRKKDSQDE
ncbi:MAG: DedA family protein [Cytophagaceae bacterium]